MLININKAQMFFLKKRIFLSGGTGFIGINLLNYLIDNNIIPDQLTILSRNPDKFLTKHPYFNLDWIQFECGDINNLKWNNKQYDYFIHAAASVISPPDSIQWFDEIVSGTKKALEFAKDAGVKYFINMSSGGVYKKNTETNILSEDSPLCNDLNNMSNSYGIGKIAAEHLTYLYAKQFGFKSVSLRCFAMTGQFLNYKHFALGEFIYKAINNQNICVNAGNGIYRSYIDIQDLFRGLFTLIINSEKQILPHEIYNIGSDRAISLPELAILTVKILNSSSKIETPNLQNKEINYYVPNINKLKQSFSLVHNLISLEQQITKLANFYKNS